MAHSTRSAIQLPNPAANRDPHTMRYGRCARASSNADNIPCHDGPSAS